MSETVSEFMEKPYKKYECGIREAETKKTLTEAFCASCGDRAKHEGMMFESILDAVMAIKKGRETLMTLADLGYSFAFETGKFGGFCDAPNKKVVLNPTQKFEYLMRVVVHEGRHAIQASLTSENAPEVQDMQAASYYKKSRAIEADATAHEMAFVYEAREIDPAVYESAKEQNLPMFKAFVDEMDKSGDEKKAMQAGFEAWYEAPTYIGYYDSYHKNSLKSVADKAVSVKYADAFSKEYKNEDILKMCRYNSEAYISSEFLDSPKAFSLGLDHKQDLVQVMNDYLKAFPDAKKDTSFMKMHTRNKETVCGRYQTPCSSSQNASVKALLLAGREF